MIEQELGKEAIILSSRNAKLPSGGAVIELVAALDDKTVNTQPKANIYQNSSMLSSSKETIANEINTKLISEITSLKSMVMQVADNVKYRHTGTMTETMARVYKILRNSDISEEFALEITGRIAIKGYANDYKQAIDEARQIIMNRLTFANPIKQSPARQIAMFYGPTGCGKTTSLIKLALVCKLLYKANILIVSADTYKVGGIEQLQTLASISGIAFTAVYNPQDLRDVVKNETAYDMIMIDTVGQNPNNRENMDILHDYAKAAAPDLRMLVLSATTSESALLNTIDKFQPFGINSTIVTKVDESSGMGNITSAMVQRKIPMAYFSTGQKIPEDLELADSDKLNEYLLIV